MTDGHRDPESPARGQTFPPPRPSTRTRTCVATPQSTHAREPALASMAALPWLARAARPPCQAATASSHRVAQRAPVARGPPRVPFPRTHSSLFPLPCVLSLHSHPKPTHPRPPATQTRCPLDQHPESRSIWTCGLDPGVRLLSAPAGPRAHTHAHTRRRDPVLCPALPCPALPGCCYRNRHGARCNLFFFCFFFLPFLVWLGRCVNAVGERIGAVLARVGKASGSRMLGRCSSCCGMCEAGLFVVVVVVHSETNSLVSDRETGRFACVVRDLRCRGLSIGICLLPTMANRRERIQWGRDPELVVPPQPT
jgi:hypothetical protein